MSTKIPTHPIYTDLDHVLIAPVHDPISGLPIDVIVRPDVAWFLESISHYGEVCLLTAAERDWAKYALSEIGDAMKLISRVYSIEDLYPIALRLEIIEKVQDPRDREELLAQIPPILPQGVIFDDYAEGSWMNDLKGTATGMPKTTPSMWVQVEAFTETGIDAGGLRKAFEDFLKRNAAWSLPKGRPAGEMAGLRA